MSKYNNVKCADMSGFIHDSKREAHRANELLLMEKAGAISELHQQVPFALIPAQKLSNGKTERECVYVADFTYWEKGRYIVEDVKGCKKGIAYQLFSIKRKLMKQVHNIEIREV